MTLQFFSPKEAEILEVLTERMVEGDPPDAGGQPRGHADGVPEHSASMTTIDAFVAGLPLNLQAQLRQALHLFQWCPILFIRKPRPFTRLSLSDAETYIRSWAESRFEIRRRLFRGLRDVAFLGYYSQEDVCR